MKSFINSWFWVIALCATFGLAPYFPEPHIWGKLCWIDGGAIGMKPLDWWDFSIHAAPWGLLIRLFFLKLLIFFEKFSKMKYLNLLFIACSMLAFLGCANSQTTNQPSAKITVVAFEKWLAETPSAQLLVVRTPSEFEAGHLKNAALLGFPQQI